MAALALGLASCQNDVMTEEQSAPVSSDGIISLSVSVGNSAETRAMIELGNSDVSSEHFLWNEGDSLSLFDLGQDGSDDPQTGLTLSISSDYSDDNPSNSATFVGVGSIDDGNQVFAVYPAQDSTNGDGTFILFIDEAAALGDNSEEEIKAYMSDNIFMYASTAFSSEGTGLDFNYLVSMARISCTNASSSEQTISSVSVAGDGSYFGTECCLIFAGETSPITMSAVSSISQTFDGVTVAAGETAEFYLLFFPGADFNSDGTISITVNGQSVEMETADITTDNFSAGLRYKFNVSLTDENLVWTNAEESVDVTEILGEYIVYSEVLFAYISSPMVYVEDTLTISRNADDSSLVDVAYSNGSWGDYSITGATVTDNGDGSYSIEGSGTALIDTDLLSRSSSEYDCSFSATWAEGISEFTFSLDFMGGTTISVFEGTAPAAYYLAEGGGKTYSATLSGDLGGVAIECEISLSISLSDETAVTVTIEEQDVSLGDTTFTFSSVEVEDVEVTTDDYVTFTLAETSFVASIDETEFTWTLGGDINVQTGDSGIYVYLASGADSSDSSSTSSAVTGDDYQDGGDY